MKYFVSTYRICEGSKDYFETESLKNSIISSFVKTDKGWRMIEHGSYADIKTAEAVRIEAYHNLRWVIKQMKNENNEYHDDDFTIIVKGAGGPYRYFVEIEKDEDYNS